MDRDVIHESGRHYVVQTRSRRPAGPDVFCVRHQGPVLDRTLARFSGSFAREKAIARADALDSQGT